MDDAIAELQQLSLSKQNYCFRNDRSHSEVLETLKHKYYGDYKANIVEGENLLASIISLIVDDRLPLLYNKSESNLFYGINVPKDSKLEKCLDSEANRCFLKMAASTFKLHFKIERNDEINKYCCKIGFKPSKD